MSSWIKIKGTQTGELGLGFTGPVLRNSTGNLILRNQANTADVSLTALNITANGIFAGNGGLISNIAGANVVGQVANALVSGTVYSSAQPAITSLGTLTNLSVSGNIATGNILTDNYRYANGALINFQQPAGSNTQVQFNSNGILAGTPSFSFDNTSNTLSVTNITANGARLTNITGSNVVGQVANALVSGTVYNPAQPAITSLGTLTGLNVGGSVSITGNLSVSGNVTYVDAQSIQVRDPIIEVGSAANGANLTSNDSKDRGILLHYYTNQPIDAFMGWDNSNAEFTFGSNVSVNNDVITYNALGNIRASNFIGNIVGTATHATTANLVVNAAQPNITSVGTLSSLTVSGNVQLGQVANVKISGGSANQILVTDGTGNLYFTNPISGASAWKVKSTTLSSSSGATIALLTLPPNAIVDRVVTIVDQVFNGTLPTLSVGLSSGTGFEYVGINDVDLKLADRFDLPSKIAPSTSAQTINALYTASGSTQGSARIMVAYAIPE